MTLVQQISYKPCIAEGLRHTYPVAEAPVEHNLVTKTDLCASERSVSIGSSQDTELVKHKHAHYGQRVVPILDSGICAFNILLFCKNGGMEATKKQQKENGLVSMMKTLQGRQYKSDTRLDGCVVAITGANTGIGKYTALDLSR